MRGWVRCWIAAALACVVSALGAGCTEQRLDDSLMDRVSTTTTTMYETPPLPGQTTLPSTAQPALEAKIAAVDTGNLKIGAAFNRDFLDIEFLAIGLSQTEAQCVVDAVVTKAGSDFAARPVSQIASASGLSPDVMLPCLSMQRMADLSSGGAKPDFTRVPVSQLRATFAELAAAGYRSAGMTEAEATCLSTAVMASYTDEQLTKLTTTIQLSGAATSQAIPQCMTEDRVRAVVQG